MGTIPTIPSFAAGENLTSAKMNQIGTALGFWAAPPRVHVYRLAGFTLANATWQLVSWDQEVADTDTMHDTATNTSRLVCKTAGTYEFSGQLQYSSSATGNRQLTVRQNSAGDTTLTTGTSITTVNVSPVNGTSTSAQFGPLEIALNVGDYLEVFAYQNSGASLAMTAGQQVLFMRMRLVSTT